MQLQQTPGQRSESRPPWSLISVTIITLLLPAGGAVVTVLNLHRLGRVDAKVLRQRIALVLSVLVLGFTILFSVLGTKGGTIPAPDPVATTILSVGIAWASYIAQQTSFRAWRSTHSQEGTSPWLYALGLAFLYQLLTGLGVAIVATLLYVIAGNSLA